MLDGLEQERDIWEIRFATAQETSSRSSMSESRQFEGRLRRQANSRVERVWAPTTEHGGKPNQRCGRSPLGNCLRRKGPYLNDTLRLLRHREDLYRRTLQRMDSWSGLIENKQAEFARREQARSVLARMKEWGQATLVVLGNAWHVELFTAEDTIEVEGKNITGRRSVTVGKVVTALAILIAGYWFAGIMARFAERQAITRLQIDPNVANIIRQWALALLFPAPRDHYADIGQDSDHRLCLSWRGAGDRCRVRHPKSA